MKQLLAIGAEAELVQKKTGPEIVLVKTRKPKKYRNAILDNRIRFQRMKQEIVLLRASRDLGVRTPLVRRIDRKECAFEMEFLARPLARDELKSAKKNRVRWICSKLGGEIAKLHAGNLIHGDLTTSNVLVSDKKLVLIDFGLGFFSAKIEDQAVDLLSLKKMFLATHSEIPGGIEWILACYQKGYSNAKAVIAKMAQIEQRSRYS